MRTVQLERCILPFVLPQSSICAFRPRSQLLQQIRPPQAGLHSAPVKDVDLAYSETSSRQALNSLPPRAEEKAVSVLDSIELSQLLRTYFITSISSSPSLLGASTILLRRMLESQNPLFSVESNPALRALLWESFYKQFCAGETAEQVSRTCDGLRQQGYSGVILEYALEVLKDTESHESEDVATWKQGMLDTVDMAADGDLVGLKWSGMGTAAMRRMRNEESPSEDMDAAMTAVCDAAAKRNIALLAAAEETWSLNGLHAWSLGLQRRYNVSGNSVVYNTYQAYLKQTAGTLSQHLAIAKQEGFILGVKLVRGAYLESEKRDLIYPTIEDTHHAYDAITSALIHREYNDVLTPSGEVSHKGEDWPAVNVVIASHNASTVEKAQSLRQKQAAQGVQLTPLVFAQLQGMADEVSFQLIASGKAGKDDPTAVKERVFKCTVWGSMFECLNYLLRRAAENKDAASRTSDTRTATQTELSRRLKSVFHFG